MSEHNENPADFPAAWIREEVLSDIRLDGVSLKEAVACGLQIFREALGAYAVAVSKQDSRLAAASTRPGYHPHGYQTAGFSLRSENRQPQVIALCNGPAFTLALVVRHNRLDVVDIGNAP